MKNKTPTTVRLITMYLAAIIVYCALIFWPAGTIFWPQAWLLIFLQFSYSIFLAVWLKKNNPQLLASRMRYSKKDMIWWDKLVSYGSIPIFMTMFIIPGLENIRYQITYTPDYYVYTGFMLFVISELIIAAVMKENTYLSRLVEVQKDIKQKVIDTGPYAMVRHPMYVGVIMMFLSIPMALGSIYALIPSLLMSGIIVARIFGEEDVLKKELEGYTAYTKKVKYRLLPGIF